MAGECSVQKMYFYLIHQILQISSSESFLTTLGQTGDIVFEVVPGDQDAESGQSVTFSCKINGTRPIGKQWNTL